MVHNTFSKGQSEDHQGRFPACSLAADSHVQFFRIQRYRRLTEEVAIRSLTAEDTKVVYRRYASLFFIAGCSSTDNELATLEIVHRYVEQMDKYYGNVCELDIIFNFQKAYFILDELLLAGEMQESSKKNVLKCISQQDSLEDMEVSLRNGEHEAYISSNFMRSLLGSCTYSASYRRHQACRSLTINIVVRSRMTALPKSADRTSLLTLVHMYSTCIFWRLGIHIDHSKHGPRLTYMLLLNPYRYRRLYPIISNAVGSYN